MEIAGQPRLMIKINHYGVFVYVFHSIRLPCSRSWFDHRFVCSEERSDVVTAHWHHDMNDQQCQGDEV